MNFTPNYTFQITSHVYPVNPIQINACIAHLIVTLPKCKIKLAVNVIKLRMLYKVSKKTRAISILIGDSIQNNKEFVNNTLINCLMCSVLLRHPIEPTVPS